MKKYKLVKIYPGSPPLNSIVENWMYTYDISKEKEHWQEIVEYPIGTKVRDNRINKTFTKKEDGWYNSNKTGHTDESISGATWIEIVDDKIVDNNPLKLEVDKTYELQYIHCESKPFKAIITRITSDGYPWMEKMHCSDNGIVTDSYKLIKEIVDKNYEILSSTDDYGYIYLLSELTEKQLTFFYNNLGVLSDVLINSVKRLSDNTIFTIDDYVRPKKCKHNAFTITGFTLDCNNEHMLALGGNGGIRIDKLNLSDKPLFKTFDNVDIFENDRYYGCELGIYRFINDIAHKNVTYSNNGNIYFSSKEKAEEYILMNKPCLSIEEVVNISYNPAESYTSSSRKLKELVKSKL